MYCDGIDDFGLVSSGFQPSQAEITTQTMGVLGHCVLFSMGAGANLTHLAHQYQFALPEGKASG